MIRVNLKAIMLSESSHPQNSTQEATTDMHVKSRQIQKGQWLPWGERGTTNAYGVSFEWDENVLKRHWWWLYNSKNTLKTSGPYMLMGELYNMWSVSP